MFNLTRSIKWGDLMQLNYILHLVLANVVKKKKRTLLSIFSVMLSAMIMFSSMSILFVVSEYKTNQTDPFYHYAFYSEKKVDLLNSQYQVIWDGNTGYYSHYQNQLINLRCVEATRLPVDLIEGTYPKTSREIMVSNSLGLSISDELALKYCFDNSQTRNLYLNPETINETDLMEFKVVGIFEEHDAKKRLHHEIELIYTTNIDCIGHVYYVLDQKAYLEDGFNAFHSQLGIPIENIIVNHDAIYETGLNHYLMDIKILLVLFLIIILLGLIISYRAIHNVIIFCDRERKKELGLLKSVGATPLQIQSLIFFEFLALSLMGASLGILFSHIMVSYIFKEITSNIPSLVILKYEFNLFIAIISLFISVGLMLLAGFRTYQSVFDSMPIQDLKDRPFYEALEMKERPIIFKEFQWRMFSVYTSRMHKHMKNMIHAFTLLLICTSLFLSVFLSLALYNQRYEKHNYDFEITSSEINPQVSEYLYHLSLEEMSKIKNEIYPERAISGLTKFYCLEDFGNKKLVSKLTQTQINNITYYDIVHQPLVLDSNQLSELRNHVVDGSIDHLGSKDVIIIHLNDSEYGRKFRENVSIGEKVYINEEPYTIRALVVIDALNCSNIHINFQQYQEYCAISYDEWLKDGLVKNSFENIQIKLSSDLYANHVLGILEDAISYANAKEEYQVKSLIHTLNENQLMTFFFKTLLYPLIGMLFLATLFNIYQVVQSDVYLKKLDLSIFKSVGLKPKQLYQLFLLEYLEGYFTASFITTLITLPVSILISKLNIATILDFGENILGAYILSIGFFGVLLLCPMVLIIFNQLRKIKATDGLKNQF